MKKESSFNLDDNFSALSIVVVTHVFTTGISQELASFLMRRVKRLAFIGHPFSYSRQECSNATLYERGVLKRTIKAPPIKGPEILLYLKDFLFTLYFVSKIGKFDIYYGADNLNAFAGILLKKLGFVEIVVFHTIDYVPKRFQNRILRGIYHFLDKISCYYSDFVWNTSSLMAEIRHKRGIAREKCAPQIVVPNGVHFRRIRRLKLEEINRFYIAYVGHLVESKGIELIVETLPRILRQVPEARLVIIGTGPLENFLKVRVRQLNLDNVVEFKGLIESHAELEGILTTCAVGVAPYVPDPNNIALYTDPGKPILYMGCALPVIIVKVPRIAHEIEKRKAGIAISYDKSELAEAIVILLKNDELYRQFRENAKKFASEFDWELLFRKAFSTLYGIASYPVK